MEKISIGMLAHNEQATIAATIDDLLAQDLLTDPAAEVEIIILVNGSVDHSAELARARLAGWGATTGSPCRARVEEIARAGKANAWNMLVHHYVDPAAAILICMDADIRLPQTDLFSRLLAALRQRPAAVAVVDQPVKSFSFRRRLTPRERLSALAGDQALYGPPKLCGQLYAARMTALRKITLPEPLLVEDGFIKAMLTTDCLSRPAREDALTRAEGAFHLFEAETGLYEVFRHERRIILGTICNIILFRYLGQLRDHRGEDPGDAVRRLHAKDPDWLVNLVRREAWSPRRLADIGEITALPLRQWLGGRRTPLGLVAAMARSMLGLVASFAAWWQMVVGVLRW